MKKVEGIIPVMITPFDEANKIDYAGLERLIERLHHLGLGAGEPQVHPSGVHRLLGLEQRQYVLRTFSGPPCQQMVLRIGEQPPTTDRDHAQVAVLDPPSRLPSGEFALHAADPEGNVLCLFAA